MPPSRSELEAMADDLGLTGSERAAFVGDVTPTPKPKAVAAPKPTATTPTTSAPKATTVAAKPKEPAKVTAFVDEPWPEYGPPAPMKLDARPEGVGPRVAVGMTPAPSRDVSALLGQQGTARLMAVEQGLVNAGAGIDAMLDPRFKDRAALSTVRLTGPPANPLAEAEAKKEQERAAAKAAVQKPAPAPAPQPTPAPKPAPPPATVSGGVTLQQAVDGLRTMGVPQAVIEAELKKGEDGQRNVIDAYRNRTEK